MLVGTAMLQARVIGARLAPRQSNGSSQAPTTVWIKSTPSPTSRTTTDTVAIGVARRNPAATSPTTTTTTTTAAGETDAEKKLRFIEEVTADVDAVQERVLADILARNAEAEYLAVRCGLAGGGAADRATFRAKVPMVTYEDLQPYIRRIVDGDLSSPILSTRPVSEFIASSGTSGGERKLMPIVDDELDRRNLMYVPGIEDGNGLYFLFVKSETKTPSGLPAWTVLTSYYKSEHFKNRAAAGGGGADTYHHRCTSPAAAILCEDTFQSMYAQMVCGLCQRHDVVRVGAVFASGLLRAVHFLQQHWEELAADIAAGELSARVSDPSVRKAVAGPTPSSPSSSAPSAAATATTGPASLVTTKRRRQGGGGGAMVDRETLDRCCLEMEEAMNAVYRQGRVADGTIGPLEIRIVQPGTFEELMDFAIAHGSSAGRYKVPRCVAAPAIIELLDSHVVSSHFSASLPCWTPAA